LGFGIWDLGFGIWDLGFGIWDLGFNIFYPVFRGGFLENEEKYFLGLFPITEMTYKSYMDMEVWQRARAFSQRIYCLSKNGSFASDFSLKDQINSSSGSIMDNIAEGFERDGTKEFRCFLSYAKGSAGECVSQLHRAFDRKHIDQKEFTELKSEGIILGNQLGGFISYLRGVEHAGKKFKKKKKLSPNAS
jgi:four helix bundle protein